MTEVEIIRAIRSALEDEALCVVSSLEADTRLTDIPRWDNLVHGLVVGKLRDRYGLKFNIADTYGAITVGDLAAMMGEPP